MSHLIKIYSVCKFSYFRLWYLKSYIGSALKKRLCYLRNKFFLLRVNLGEQSLPVNVGLTSEGEANS